MKKIILLISICPFIFAKSADIVIKKKENINNTFIENIILIKNSFIEKTNNLLPTPLQINKKESTFKTKISFNSLTKKAKLNLNVNLKLPFFEIKQNKKEKIKKKKTTKIKQYYIDLKIRPILRINKSLIPYIKFNLSQSYNKIFYNNYIFKYFIHNKKWDFTDEYLLQKHLFAFKIFLHFDKDELKDVDYGKGFYYFLKKTKKNIILTGYELTGIANKKPFFSSHKLFLTFKSKVFNSNRTTFELTPYLLYKKDKKFKFNVVFFSALTYQF